MNADASNINNSALKYYRLHRSSLVTPYEWAILNKNVEQRRDEHKSASSNARGNLNSCHDPPCCGEQTSDIEHTRMEVIPSLRGEQTSDIEQTRTEVIPSLRGEQTSDLEQTRTEVIWTEYRQVDGTEHPARFRTNEVQICQISFCEDAPLSIARTE